MRINDFIDELAALGVEWEIDKDGCVSWKGEDSCPIWTAYHHANRDDEYPEDYCEAGRRLGLSDKQVSSIVAAADNRAPFNVAIRKRLLSLAARQEPNP